MYSCSKLIAFLVADLIQRFCFVQYSVKAWAKHCLDGTRITVVKVHYAPFGGGSSINVCTTEKALSRITAELSCQ